LNNELSVFEDFNSSFRGDIESIIKLPNGVVFSTGDGFYIKKKDYIESEHYNSFEHALIGLLFNNNTSNTVHIIFDNQ